MSWLLNYFAQNGDCLLHSSKICLKVTRQIYSLLMHDFLSRLSIYLNWNLSDLWSVPAFKDAFVAFWPLVLTSPICQATNWPLYFKTKKGQNCLLNQYFYRRGFASLIHSPHGTAGFVVMLGGGEVMGVGKVVVDWHGWRCFSTLHVILQ